MAEGLIPSGEASPAPKAISRKAAAVAAAVFLLSLLPRLATLERALPSGMPRLAPFDDLYHALRMDEAMAKSGRVSGFDPGRGPRGAFCPWPPFYDASAGLAAKLTGARDTTSMLRFVFWLPPIAASVFAAALAFALAWRLGPATGLLAGLAATLAPPFLEATRVGAIDHHFLEPMLLLLVLGAAAAISGATARERLTQGALLGVAMTLALFVQPALLLAAGAVAVLLLLFGQQGENLSGAVAFAVAGEAVLLFQAAQPAGYPEGSWYLGLPHAALLAGAGVACAAAAILARRGVGRGGSIAAALLLGLLVAAAFPGAAAAIPPGARFLRGDPWLDTVVEFQPLFDRGWRGAPESLSAVGGGALLLLLLAPAWLRSGGARRSLAVLGLVYLAATLVTRRFLVPATPLLAVAGAVAVGDLRRRKGVAAAAAAGAVLLAPALLGAWLLLARPSPVVPPRAVPILRAAEALRAAPGGGRVLASWSWGHAFHVAGGRPVVVDNFGSSIGQTDFQNALGIVLSPREEAVADYCRQTGVRFLALENPLANLTVQAQAIGLSSSLFVRTDPAGPPQITPRMRFSFWWRAYFDQGAAVRETRRESPAFRQFRLLYADKDVTGTGRFRGPAVQIWEFSGGSLP